MRILTFSCLVQALLALQYGDRVSTLLQAVHRGWKTPWVDISIHQMPRFRTPDSTILHVSLPHEDENGPEMKLNPQEDVKFSITFDKNKLIVPWTVLFDASKRRTLQKLIVTFSHDEFQILKVNFETVYGSKIQRLDPSHPSITAFEMVYKWQPVQEQDLAVGLFVMFSLSLVIVIAMTCLISFTYDRDSGLVDPRSKSQPKSNGKASAGFSTSRRK